MDSDIIEKNLEEDYEYSSQEDLGQGGSGVVKEMKNRKTKNVYAVKIMKFDDKD